MKLKRLLILILCTLTIISLLYFVNAKRPENGYTITQILKNKMLSAEENQPQNATIKDPVPSPTNIISEPKLSTNFQTYAWVPNFDITNGLSSAIKNKNKITAIHYAGASIGENGNINYSNGFDANLIKFNQSGVSFGLNIISSNVNATKNFITNLENKNTFLDKMSSIKSANQSFRAVNLDIEKMNLEEKSNFIDYLKDVKLKLNEKNIQLFLTIFGEEKNISSPFDLKRIGENVDQIILMTYDYTLRANKKAGFEKANAPDFFVNDVLENAVNLIPKEKIILGLPLYGYGFNKTTNKITTAYTYSQLQNMKLIPQLNEEFGEMYVERPNEIIYFQNQTTLNRKKVIAEKYGVNKVFYWRLGGEGDLLN
jgi:spore germination protein